MVGAIGSSQTTNWYKPSLARETQQSVDQTQHLAQEKEKNKDNQLDPEIQQQIQQYVSAENKVKAHEQAHKAVGGQYAGGISYDYKNGPDGKQYIVGGEVPINAPEGKDPEDSIRILEQVRRAALAPADPSPQDLQVAAGATQKIMEATSHLQEKPHEQDMDEKKQNLYDIAKQTYQNHQALMKRPETIFDQAI